VNCPLNLASPGRSRPLGSSVWTSASAVQPFRLAACDVYPSYLSRV